MNQLAPLVAFQWPSKKFELGERQEDFVRLFESLALILTEQVDLLIVASDDEMNNILQRLVQFNVPEDFIYFIQGRTKQWALQPGHELHVVRDSQGHEAIKLLESQTNSTLKILSLHGVEYLKFGDLVVVPIYDETVEEDHLAQVAEFFPTLEVIAVDCDCLNEKKLKLSELFLFAN